jgi:hypothetical protein
MPPIKSKPKDNVPKPAIKPGKPDIVKAVRTVASVKALPTATLEQTGQAVILAGLAEELGMHVPHVVEFPQRLLTAGLPVKLDRWVVDLAHRLNRNAIDATLFRCNRPTTQQPPDTSWDEALAAKAQDVPARKQEAPKVKAVAPPPPPRSIFDD